VQRHNEPQQHGGRQPGNHCVMVRHVGAFRKSGRLIVHERLRNSLNLLCATEIHLNGTTLGPPLFD
jgi:hypothetical protein